MCACVSVCLSLIEKSMAELNYTMKNQEIFLFLRLRMIKKMSRLRIEGNCQCLNRFMRK